MVHDGWSASDAYEQFMGRWSRLLAVEAVRRMTPEPGQRWLDVGCGTGALSAAIVAGARPSSLLGIDSSSAFTEAASASLGGERVVFRVGTADALAVADASVDRVGSGLVLNFVPDVRAALREMRRVLVPGGHASAYVWDYAEGMEMLLHFWRAAAAEIPGAEEFDEGRRFPICRPGALAEAFRRAGFVELDDTAVDIPTSFDDFDDYWQPFLGGQGAAGAYCATLSAQDQARISTRLNAELPRQPDGSIVLRARAWLVTGLAPSAP